VTKPCFDTKRAFIPWCSNTTELLAAVTELGVEIEAAGIDIATVDLIIHAGINGVLTNLPDHGLDAADVRMFGFRRVFAGHYHNHKSMEDDRVISIGATTHQTWGDIGTKAGFLIVEEDSFRWFASHAPSFVEITSATEPDEIPLIADGNYVRVRDFRLTDAEVQLMRKELIGFGAKGISFQVAREVVSARGEAPTKVSSLDESIDGFITTKLAEEEADLVSDVRTYCADILSKTRSLAVETV
jgi:DNA repair exonuclease SbcCD nuclease subunit